MHLANARDLTDAQWNILDDLIPEPITRENGYLSAGTDPASVTGGATELGFCASSAPFVGPGSLLLLSVIPPAFCRPS
jgi:hypothetical protein